MDLKRIGFSVVLCALASFLASPAFSATLKVRSVRGAVDRTLDVPIVVDDPASIAGAAFMLQYSSRLSVSVDSRFFDMFYDQFDPLETTGTAVWDGSQWNFPRLDAYGDPLLDAEGNPSTLSDRTEIDGVVYAQSVLDNVEKQGAVTTHRIAGARPTAAATGEEPTLFTLRVTLRAGQPPGKYAIRILPATVNNPDAGYSPAGETVDLLVGADTSGSSFPVILDDRDYAAGVVDGHVEFRTDMDGMQEFVDPEDPVSESRPSGGGGSGGSCFIDAMMGVWDGGIRR